MKEASAQGRSVRELVPQDASAIAALWHAGGLESGARDAGFLPRMPVADYAKQLSIVPRSSAVWGKLGFRPYLQRGYLHIGAAE